LRDHEPKNQTHSKENQKKGRTAAENIASKISPPSFMEQKHLPSPISSSHFRSQKRGHGEKRHQHQHYPRPAKTNKYCTIKH